MTSDRPDPPAANPDRSRSGTASDALSRRIAAVVLRARLAIFWEALWPRLALPLGIVALFAAIAFMGLWPLFPDSLRIAALVLFALGFLASLVPLVRLSLPDRQVARDRAERESGLTNRPLTALEDDQFTGRDDPAGRALWRAHRKAAAKRLDHMVAGYPSPKLYRHDPFALRALVGLLLFIGVFAGYGEYGSRLGDSFRASAPAATTPPTRLDAWIDPPAYTNRPPLFLTGETPAAGGKDGVITAPAGSVLLARLHGTTSATLRVEHADGGTETVSPEGKASDRAAKPLGAAEFRLALSKDTAVSIEDEGREIARWRFAIDPDAAPTIALSADPTATVSGATELAYTVTDDYGVLAATAHIEPQPDKAGKEDARPLYEPPTFPLTLPQRGTRNGNGRTIRDLSSHPFAGGPVRMRLTARDAADQEGTSEPYDFVLPQRRFSKALARALVEQRRVLALDARDRGRVQDALDALMIAPEKFIPEPGIYLGMRFAYARLVKAKTDDDLREVADLLWTLALSIEDGEISLARRELREAQEALRKALEEGASDEEIRRLTEQLRAALDRFLNSVAEEARRNPQNAMPMPPNGRMIDRNQLERMLSRIEELARSGSRDAARDLLAQMQRMMENMQTGRQSPQNERSAEMNRMLQQLADMIARQRELMDKTFRMDQNGSGERSDSGQQGEQRPMTEEELQQALRDLQAQQEALMKDLEAMQKRMGEMGLDAGEQMGEAGRSMGEAGKNLGQGETGSAVGNQGDALSALQRGAGRLLDQMMAEGMGQGPGGRRRQGQNGQGDPLGRNTGGTNPNDTVKIPDEIDVQRARRILEELRRRLGDPARPRLELDYLDRLLPRD